MCLKCIVARRTASGRKSLKNPAQNHILTAYPRPREPFCKAYADRDDAIEWPPSKTSPERRALPWTEPSRVVAFNAFHGIDTAQSPSSVTSDFFELPFQETAVGSSQLLPSANVTLPHRSIDVEDPANRQSTTKAAASPGRDKAGDSKPNQGATAEPAIARETTAVSISDDSHKPDIAVDDEPLLTESRDLVSASITTAVSNRAVVATDAQPTTNNLSEDFYVNHTQKSDDYNDHTMAQPRFDRLNMSEERPNSTQAYLSSKPKVLVKREILASAPKGPLPAIPPLEAQRLSPLQIRLEHLHKHQVKLQREYQGLVDRQEEAAESIAQIKLEVYTSGVTTTKHTSEIADLRSTQYALASELAKLRVTVESCVNQLENHDSVPPAKDRSHAREESDGLANVAVRKSLSTNGPPELSAAMLRKATRATRLTLSEYKRSGAHVVIPSPVQRQNSESGIIETVGEVDLTSNEPQGTAVAVDEPGSEFVLGTEAAKSLSLHVDDALVASTPRALQNRDQIKRLDTLPLVTPPLMLEKSKERPKGKRDMFKAVPREQVSDATHYLRFKKRVANS